MGFISVQKTLLEELFDKEWLTDFKNKNHPAFIRYNICNRLESQGGFRYPENENLISEIASMFLDSYYIIALSEGDLSKLKLGNLDLYGDKQVNKKISSNIKDPEKFSDLMVELYVGAWNKLEDRIVKPMEKEGYPDIMVINNGKKIFVECKNLKTESENKIQEKIRHANNQIKNAKAKHGGVVILDISHITGINQVQYDDYPSKVKQIAEIVQNTINGDKNSLVKTVIIVWDDFLVNRGTEHKATVAYRRRTLQLHHQTHGFGERDNAFVFNGYTAAFSINFSPRTYPASKVDLTSGFQENFLDKFSLKFDDVKKTIESYDRTEIFKLDDDEELLIYLSKPFEGTKPFRILLCTRVKNEKLLLDWAFKIFENISPNFHFLTPLQILDRFVHKFGLYFTIQEIKTKMIWFHNIKEIEPDLKKIIQIENPKDHALTGSFMIKFLAQTNPAPAVCALVFVINRTRYMGWIS